MGELERRDYYGDLYLPSGVSDAVIRQRFKRLARKFHPDVNRAADAAERFRRIRLAYEVLTDPRRKAVVESWYSAAKQFGRRRYQGDAAEVPPRPQQGRRAQRFERFEDDRRWVFGCFSLLGFVMALFSGLPAAASSLREAFLIALAAGVAIGLLAAFGGARVRESLLWILFRHPW
jgi:DnaJ-class molecular chaperone